MLLSTQLLEKGGTHDGEPQTEFSFSAHASEAEPTSYVVPAPTGLPPLSPKTWLDSLSRLASWSVGRLSVLQGPHGPAQG